MTAATSSTTNNPATAGQPAQNRPAGPMLAGRQADSARRRQRVIATLNRAASAGQEISVSGIARAAGVDRTFLYRHRDLLAQVHALETAPPVTNGTGPTVTRASLQADLLAAQERTLRLAARVQQLERRLSEALGEQAWRESGLGAPADIDALNHKLTPRAAGHRPPPPARRPRPGPSRGPRRKPRAHQPAQHHGTPTLTRRASSLHHTCGTR